MSRRNKAAPNGATVDHVVPKAAGGSGATRNLRLACRDCNQKKANRMPTYEEILRLGPLEPTTRGELIAAAMRRHQVSFTSHTPTGATP